MRTGQRVVAQVQRLGVRAEVRTRTETGDNSFGNPTDDHVPDREVWAVRTYPNRNTEVNSDRGDRHRDRPVFIVPKGEDQPAVPSEEDQIDYNGTLYEVQALTRYPTHVEFFGAPVRSPDGDS